MIAEPIIDEADAPPPLLPRVSRLPAMTPPEMLSRAIETGASLDMVSKLMDLQDRWSATEAAKAFREAFAAFKGEAVTIVRNKKITDGPLKGKSYAELYTFVDAVTPALSKYGLSASWNVTRDEKDWIEVACVIEHTLGHSKTVKFGGPPDSGGAKNPLQARMSTITYLERHTLKAACGLAEQGDDSDGNVRKETRKDESPPVSMAQLEVLRKALDATGSKAEALLAHMKLPPDIGVPDLTSEEYGEAMAILTAKAKRLGVMIDG